MVEEVTGTQDPLDAMARAGLFAPDPLDRMDELGLFAPEPGVGDYAREFPKSLARGALHGTAGAMAGLYNLLPGSETEATTENTLEAFGMKDAAEALAPDPRIASEEGFARWLVETFPEMAGGVAPLLAGGGVAGLAGVAGVGALQGGQAQHEAAQAAGATPGQDVAATLGGGAIGALGVFGPAGMLARGGVRPLAAEALSGFLTGAGQDLAVQGLEKATYAPERKISVPQALETGATLGVLGGGMHLAGKLAGRGEPRKPLEKSEIPPDVEAAALPGVEAASTATPSTLRASAPEGLRTVEPLTPENVNKGEARFDPETQQWVVDAPAERPQEAANVPRETGIVGEQAPAKTSSAADLLLRANKTEGQVVSGQRPEHTFAEEFARTHGMEVDWVDGGKDLDLPGVYLGGRAALDVRRDPIGLVYHEGFHGLLEAEPEVGARVIREMREAEPEYFARQMAEYEALFQDATGRKLSEALRSEEGAARLVERLKGYVSGALQHREHLQALLEHDPTIVQRILNHVIRKLQKMGVNRWKTSQQKALISMRVFASTPYERGLKPNRAAAMALKIADAFATIEGRDLAAEAAAKKAARAAEETPAESPKKGQVEGQLPATPPATAPDVKTGWEGFDPNVSVVEQLSHPKVREHLLSTIAGMGQAQRGGMLMWSGAEVDRRVTGRTSWVAKSPWWMKRPGTAGAKVWEALVRRAVSDKPGKFTENQAEMLQFLIDQPKGEPEAYQDLVLREQAEKRAPEPDSDEAIAAREDEGGPKREVAGEEAPFAVRGKGEMPDEGILARMSEIMRGRGFEIRGAKDVRAFIEGAKGLEGLYARNPSWKAAYEQAVAEKAGTFVRPETKPLAFENVDMKALKKMGTTTDMREAGYIAPTGALLDFSGKREGGTRGRRALDHREVGGYAGMQELLSNGYARIDFNSGSVQLGARPSERLEAGLLRFFREHNGEIYLDVGERYGPYREKYEQYGEPERGTNLNYQAGTKPEKILGDIRRFYRGEEIQGGERFAVRGKDDDIDPLGFYSPLRRALNSEKLPGKASGSDWLNIIRKAPGAKRDEIEWSGVEDFLEGKKSVTKQELQEYLRENEVRIEEASKGPRQRSIMASLARYEREERLAADALMRAAPELAGENAPTLDYFMREVNRNKEYAESLRAAAPEAWAAYARARSRAEQLDVGTTPDRPVYPGPSYRLPGGENYRELLLRLPKSKDPQHEAAIDAAEREFKDALAIAQASMDEYRALNRELSARLEAMGSSQLDTANILLSDTSATSRKLVESGDAETLRIARRYWTAQERAGETGRDANMAQRAYYRLTDSRGEGQFTEGHWSEPNVLAHMRTTDRTDAAGKNTLFLEEVQSDWMQKARDEGFKATQPQMEAAKSRLHEAQGAAYDAIKRLDDLGFDNRSEALASVFHSVRDGISIASHYDIADHPADVAALENWVHESLAFAELAASKIPRAPFSETWHELALRRAVRYAAENGYEQIAWAPGLDQVKRYESELRKTVDRIMVFPAENQARPSVKVVGIKGDNQVFSHNVPLKGKISAGGKQASLKELLGHDMHQTVMADPSKKHTFEGENLTIGGKGMQTFYDKMLPIAADRIGKQWGVKAGETFLPERWGRLEVGKHPQVGWGIWDPLARGGSGEWIGSGHNTEALAREAAEQIRASHPEHRIHSLEITPEMRASVLDEGLPRFAVAKGGDKEGFDAPDDTMSAKFRRALVNDLDRIEVIEAAAGKKIAGDSLQTLGRLFPGRTYGEVEKLRKQILDPMKRVMRANKIQPFKGTDAEPSASDFLYALAAIKANETLANESPKKYGTLFNPGSGMSSVDAAKIRDTALDGPKGAAYREIQRLNRSLNARRLDAWAAGGLIAREQRAELVRRWGLDYVPFRTADDPAVKNADVPLRNKGFNVSGKEFKARKGRSTKADSPLAFAFDTAEQAIQRKERNRMGQALAAWTEANDLGDFLRVETDANNIKDNEFRLSFKKNGEQRWLVTKDKGLNDAFKRLGPEPGVLRVLDPALKFLHSTIIRWNPAFPFYNLPKDLGTAATKVGIEHGLDWSAAVIKNAPKYIRGAWKVLRDENAKGKEADLYRDARDAGALVGWNESFDIPQRLTDMESAVNRGNLREGWSNLLDVFDDANRAVELGTRLAVYDKAIRSGKSKSEAAVLARKVTADFAQRGTLTPVMRRLFLFFGASVQGTREIMGALANNPVRGAAAFGAFMSLGFMAGSLSYLLADEDENGGSKYDRMSQYQLSHKGGLMVGDRLYGMPLPWFWNVPYYLGVQAAQMKYGDRKAKDAVPDVLTAALQAMSPIQGSDPMQALTPTLLRPAQEIAANKDFAGQPIRPTADPFDRTPTPRSEQAFRDINPVLQAATRTLNRWTGGNSVTEGAVSVSPADIEHVIKFLAGGLGANSWRAMEQGRKMLSGEPVTLPDFPIARAYVAKPGDGAGAQLYYRNLSRVFTSAEEVKAGEKPHEPRLAGLKVMADRVDQTVARLRRARNQAREQGLDTKELEQAMKDVMAAFNREVLRAGQGSGIKQPTPMEAASR